MMTHAYDKTYLYDAMDNLGFMLDYGVNACGFSLEQFYMRFLASPAALAFAMGHPRYLAGLSGIELAHLVLRQTGAQAQEALPFYPAERSAEFWTGWALAYLQWYYGKDFNTLASRGIDATFLLQRYPVLHEADLSVTLQLTDSIMDAKRPSQLKRIRKAAGLTQEELALRTGISLRMIRAYEQQSQSLEKAEYRTLSTLSQVLGCSPVAIL